MTAIAELTAAFDETFLRLGQGPDGDGDVVLTSWPSVPVEIVRAAGLRPVVARGSSADTPAADIHLEADIFPSRIRHPDDAIVGTLLVPHESWSCGMPDGIRALKPARHRWRCSGTHHGHRPARRRGLSAARRPGDHRCAISLADDRR